MGSLWNNVIQIDAAKISRNMYSESDNVGVESDLVNSYAWDTAIVFIQEMGNTNYASKDTWNEQIINTGISGDKVCNIYDVASNCYEWSTEYCSLKDNTNAYPCEVRGGDSNFSHFASGRNFMKVTAQYEMYSFRVILYMD